MNDKALVRTTSNVYQYFSLDNQLINAKEIAINQPTLIQITVVKSDFQTIICNVSAGIVQQNQTLELFDKNNKGLCVIDTDTVMSGIVHYDFGDAIRTICNTAAEDEKNLEKVHFNIAFYKAYKKGFLEELKDNLTPTELEHLPLSAKTMIFIMALRFLTDYLNNDIYYKTDFEDHNLVRSKNQFKLLESFNLNMT